MKKLLSNDSRFFSFNRDFYFTIDFSVESVILLVEETFLIALPTGRESPFEVSVSSTKVLCIEPATF